MIYAVLPSTFLNSKIVNVTVIQDDPNTEVLLIDTISYDLYK